jgi:hypothetical protein
MADNGEAPKSSLFHPLIIAAFPAVSYFLAFAYEAGFASRYAIPFEWISLNLTNVFVAGGALILAMAPLYNWASVVFYIVPSWESVWKWAGPHPKRRAFTRAAVPGIVMLVLAAFVLHLIGATLSTWLKGLAWTMIYSSFFFAIEFGLPFITQKKSSNLEEKIVAQEELEKNAPNFYTSVHKIVGPNVLLGALVLGFLAVTSFLLGNRAATTQKTFLIMKGPPEVAVLRTYGNLTIGAQLDRSKMHLTKTLVTMNLSAAQMYSFVVEETGRLEISSTTITN